MNSHFGRLTRPMRKQICCFVPIQLFHPSSSISLAFSLSPPPASTATVVILHFSIKLCRIRLRQAHGCQQISSNKARFRHILLSRPSVRPCVLPHFTSCRLPAGRQLAGKGWRGGGDNLIASGLNIKERGTRFLLST